MIINKTIISKVTINAFLMVTFVFLASSLLAQKSKKEQSDSISERKDIEARFVFFNAIKEKNLGNLDLAIEGFKRSLKNDPSNDAAFYEMAKIYVAKQNFLVALEQANAAVKLNPNNVYYLLLTAELQLQLKKTKEALKSYEGVLKITPDNLEAYLAIAAIYEAQNNYKEANKYYNLAEEKSGVVYEISQQKISNYIKAGKFSEAIVEVSKLISDYPEEMGFRELLADLYIYNKQEDKAEKSLLQMVELDPAYGLAYLKLAKIKLVQKNWEQSLSYAQKGFAIPDVEIDAKMELLFIYFELVQNDNSQVQGMLNLCDLLVKIHPNDAKSHSISGDFYNANKQFEKAASEFSIAVSLAPDKLPIWKELLTIEFYVLNRTDSVLKHAEQAQSLFPYDPVFNFFAANANYFLKNYKASIRQAKEGLSNILDNKPLQADLYSILGDAYHYNQEFDLSDGSFEKSLALFPENAYVLNNYSYFLSLRKAKLDKAKTMILKALKLEAENENYIDTYAWVLYQLGEYAEAKTALEKVLRINSESATSLEHYGDVLFKLGKQQEAIVEWKKAKSFGVDSKFIDQKIAEGKLYE